MLKLLIAPALLTLAAQETPEPETRGEAPTPDALAERVAELCAAGRFAPALEVAAERHALLRAAPEHDEFEVLGAAELVAYLELAATLSKAERARLAEGHALDAKIGALKHSGDFEGVIAPRVRQIALWDELIGDQHPDLVNDLCNLADAHEAVGNFAAAEPALQRAVALARERWGDDDPRTAFALNDLGRHLLQLARHPDADLFLLEAAAILDRLERRGPVRVRNLKALSNLYVGKRHDEARRLAFEAAELAAEVHGRQSDQYAGAVDHLVAIHVADGDYDRAEELALEAIEVVAEESRYAIQLTWSTVFIRRRDGAAAEELLGEVLDALPERHSARAQALNYLAMSIDIQGRSSEAESVARQAVTTAAAVYPAGHPLVNNARNTLAVILSRQGKLDEASEIRARIADAPSNAESGSGRDVEASNLANLGTLHLKRGELDEARAALREAIELRSALLGDDHPQVVRVVLLLGAAELAAGDTKAALTLFEETARAFESARLRVGPGYERAAFLDSPYALLASALLRLDRPDEAWRAVERRYGRALFDLLRAARARPLHPVAEGQTFPLERVRAALREDEALIGWLVPTKGASAFRGLGLESWGWVLRSEGDVRWVRLDLDPARALSAVQDLVSALSEDAARLVGRPDPTTARALGHALWKDFFAPLEPELEGARRIVVVPSVVLDGAPLEALVDARERTLAERFALSYTPSATVFAWLRERTSTRAATDPAAPRRALLVGDPPFRPEHLTAMERELAEAAAGREPSRARGAGPKAERLPRLPRSRDEVEAIARLFTDPHTLLGPDASERELARLERDGAIESFDVIHFATHAWVDTAHPERSALFLSQLDLPPDGKTDGRLTAGEILSTWKLRAELVTLSACKTALGRHVTGEGLVGFTHAFLQAGADSLVVSLWQVDDEATSLLMQELYRRLFAAPDRPGARAEALRGAKGWLREYEDAEGEHPFEHPAYWSAFVLIGESE